MLKKINIFFLLGFLSLVFGCAEKKSNETLEIFSKKQEDSIQNNWVSVIQLRKKPFIEEFISNGRLEANQKSILKFDISGNLKKLFVENGDKVIRGEILASLDNFKYNQELEQAKINLKKAKLELADMLVGREYDISNIDSIPESVYEMATLRSGYQSALFQVQNSEYNVKSTNLIAPFTGKVANLQFKNYDKITADSEFLTLIDDETFDVVFNIIEYEGKVVSINPLVNDNGTIEVRAKVMNDGNLVEGMNVKVRIQKKLLNQFVVPKSAVVLRQNKNVLFKYQSGLTYWTYVDVINENSDSYAVIPDPNKSSAILKEGDTIIVDGNLDLAHNTEVKITPSDVD